MFDATIYHISQFRTSVLFSSDEFKGVKGGVKKKDVTYTVGTYFEFSISTGIGTQEGF